MRFMRRSSVDAGGFTLLEMSIVVVIIGLIAGGIIAGHQMIRASEIRSVLTDFNRYETAIGSFRAKYNEFPGDMNDATRYWGRADTGAIDSNNCAHPATDVNTTNPQATCNGNGNGHIDVYISSDTVYETFRAWQHLANAGLISGSYTGVTGPDTYIDYDVVIGVNAPQSRIPGGGFWITNNSEAFVNPGYWSGWFPTAQPATILEFGQQFTGGEPWQPLLTTEEMSSLDSKIDDGLPGTGMIVVRNPNNEACATSTNAATAQYNLTNVGLVCTPMKVIDQAN